MNVYMMATPQINWDAWTAFAYDEQLPIEKVDQFKVSQRAYPAEVLCELAGRICYMSYGKGRSTTEEFLNNIIKSGHHSVLEHANFTVFITGISRSCSHELVRHRHLSFSQLSQRYVDESTADFIMPDAIDKAGQTDVFVRAANSARTAYSIIVSNLELLYKHIEDKTLRRKAARQAARAILPNATETKIVVTGNVRAWRHFIQLRASEHADVEIRELAVKIHRALMGAGAALMFGDLQAQVDACVST